MNRSLLLFQNSLKSKETVESYTYYLDKFKDFASRELNVELDYDSLAGIKMDKMQIMVEDYIMELKKRVNPNSVPTFYYPIQSFCEANETDLRWRKIRKLFPAKIKISGNESYTTDDIQMMLSVTPQLRNKAIIHFLASTGCRIGALETLKMRHLSKMDLNCTAVLIYEDSTEEYTTFLTPEATSALYTYFEKRKQDGEELTTGAPVFRAKYILGNQPVKPTSYKGLTNVSVRATLKAGLRDPAKKKNGRFSKQIDHAFRKRFNTILKLNNSINPNIIEKLLGHKKGLDGVYLTPTTKQLFEEFAKGIPDLTINHSARTQAKLEQKEKENHTLTSKIDEINFMKKQMDTMNMELKEIAPFLPEIRKILLKKYEK